MKKLSNATQAAAHHPRAVARLTLVFVASVLAVLLALIGTGSGPNGALVYAQATGSPTGAPPPTGPAIKLLNPSQAYDPGFTMPLRPPGSNDPPKLSDKFDGVDRLYHVVAVTRDAPANATVEAYFEPTGLNEITVGTLTQVAGSTDTWEFFWDIPETMLNGGGTFKVRLFAATPSGFEEVASDETPASVQKAEEAIEMSWPSQNGQLGFHKPKGGFWRTVVEGTASADSNRVAIFYSTTPPGETVKFTRCVANTSLGAATPEGARPFVATCTLSGKDLPSQVTSIAAVAVEDDNPGPAFRNENATQESADVHRVQPYVQDVERMTVALQGVGGATGDDFPTASYPTSQRRVRNDCLRFLATVKDHLGRPVQGANLDVHLQGPDDQVGFGSDFDTSSTTEDSLYKGPNPDMVHETESSRSCFDFIDSPSDDRGTPGQEDQGDENVPGGADKKHIESIAGTGISGPGGPGGFTFFVYSNTAGFGEITAWVDEEPIANEADTREADDDLLELSEPTGTIRAQWLPAPLTISFSPRSDSAPVGTCNKYTIRARAGNAVLPGINVDVHAQGPNNDLDFCDPGDGSERRAPDQPTTGDAGHQPEDEGESSHKSSSPETPELQHTEGETDEDGNFVIGITSTATGTTQLTAWADGEEGQDNDQQGSNEASGTGSKSWAASAVDAQVRFVNPSGYGTSGDTISKKRDADERYHIVARVDLPDVVPGVEFFIGSGSTFTKIGDGVRVGDTDTWEFFWDVNVPDGSYTLRAQIAGTEKREDRAVTVNNTRETAEITNPLNGSGAAFDKGAVTVSGVASAGAFGVELYYTKTGARETRDSASWTRCGTVTLSRPGPTQNFSGKCTIASGDAPIDVSGIAALAFTCDATSGCQTVEGREVGKTRQSGDAHRVFGFEANPVVTIEPAEASGRTTTCERFELRVLDGSGRSIPDANVDVHLSGPTDTAEFCALDDGTARRSPDRGGHSASPNQADEGIHQEEDTDVHHTEGETDAGGKFVFGITSGTSGDSQILAWVDQDDNDELGDTEKSDTSVMHWGGGGGSNPKKCNIRGDRRDNVLRGTPGDDRICAGGGDDIIRGRGGNDRIFGGPGNDVMRGNAGADVLRGGTGNDRLDGGRGRDRCFGGRGRDSKTSC